MPPRKSSIRNPATNGKGEDAEMRALDRDLGSLDETDLAIGDDAKTTVDALLVILQGDPRVGGVGLDEQRAQLRQRIRIAQNLKERDEAKTLKTAYEKVLKRMYATLRLLVDALAMEEAQGLRENVTNWLHIRGNLRPVIVKSLLAKHHIDLSGIVAQAEEMEMAARSARGQAEEEVEGADAAVEEGVPA